MPGDVDYLRMILRYLAEEPVTGEEYEFLRDSETTNFLSGYWVQGRFMESPDGPVEWNFEEETLDPALAEMGAMKGHCLEYHRATSMTLLPPFGTDSYAWRAG